MRLGHRFDLNEALAIGLFILVVLIAVLLLVTELLAREVSAPIAESRATNGEARSR